MNHWGLWQINKCPKIQYSIHTQKYPSHCLRNTKWLIAENAQHFKIVHDTQTQWWIISRLPGHRVSVKSDYTRGRKFCDTFSKWYFLALCGGSPLYPEIFTVLHNDPAAPQDHFGRCRIRMLILFDTQWPENFCKNICFAGSMIAKSRQSLLK